MVVDDEAAVVTMVRRVLEQDDDFIVRSVNDVDQAKVIMRLRAPDVLITDLDLPGAPQGEDLLVHVGRTYPEALRVIHSGAADLQQLVDEGIAHAAIRKPVDREALRTTIRSLVHARFGRTTQVPQAHLKFFHDA